MGGFLIGGLDESPSWGRMWPAGRQVNSPDALQSRCLHCLVIASLDLINNLD